VAKFAPRKIQSDDIFATYCPRGTAHQEKNAKK
jgi:hypothetical protein